MKIMFNRKPISGPWGGGNSFVINMSKYLESMGHQVVYDLVYGIDLIFMIDPRPNEMGNSVGDLSLYKKSFPKVKIIHRINECDKRKNTEGMDDLLMRSNTIADKTVFISEWLAKYFQDRGFNKEYDVIYNGCDTNLFYPLKNKQIGETVKLVTHHWSDNWMKGFDIYTKLDEYLQDCQDYEFTYVGRYNKSYEPKNTNIINPLHGAALGSELRKHDIYITASRWEPCGMHHVEAAASGLPTLFHGEGGGINELCVKHGYRYDDFDSFLEKLDLLRQNFFEIRGKINHTNLGIGNCCGRYNNVITSMF